ncbi:MAG TPA: helix-turn-helix domain-containing protein [Phycisphaerae bacterium]|nr:helix-turn-helix domain-containing protein [Phycisphaerae bacterium]
MATDYLTLEEVCETLSKTPDEVQAMVADGRLSEIHDGGKIFFKKSEVDQIAAKEGSSIVDLALSDEADVQETNETFASALSDLADSSSNAGLLEENPPLEPAAQAPAELDIPTPAPAPTDSGGLAEISLEDLPEELPAAPREEAAPSDLLGSDLDLVPAEGAAPDKGSSAAIPDLGLSGSSILGLEPEKADVKPPPKEEAKPGKVGISVFDDDELPITADPMGETQISAGVPELESVGSGSGLLDLTRESDDTSLGAELLDVISPSEAADTETEGEAVEVVEAAETIEDSGPEAMEVVEAAEAPAEEEAPVLVSPRKRAPAAMRGAVPLNVCAGLGLLGLAVAALATAGAIQGVWPSFLSVIAKDIPHYAAFGGLAIIAVAIGVYGIMADRPK